MDEAQARKREARIKILVVAADLLFMAWMVWAMIPDHQRRAVIMRAALHARKASQRAAIQMGCNGMALELAAGQHAGRLWYETARLTMTGVHDRALRAYERQRK